MNLHPEAIFALEVCSRGAADRRITSDAAGNWTCPIFGQRRRRAFP